MTRLFIILLVIFLSGCASAPTYVSKYDTLIKENKLTYEEFITLIATNQIGD